MLTLVLWQRVVCLCVSSMLFGMSLVMVVRRVHNFSKEQFLLPEDDHVIETCQGILSVSM